MANKPEPLLRQKYDGSRKGKGYSLRESLICQGVTDESALRAHIKLVWETMKVAPVDITRYRVNPDNPNALAMG